MAEYGDIDLVLGKAFGVLGHAELFEPVRNLLHCGAPSHATSGEDSRMSGRRPFWPSRSATGNGRVGPPKVSYQPLFSPAADRRGRCVEISLSGRPAVRRGPLMLQDRRGGALRVKSASAASASATQAGRDSQPDAQARRAQSPCSTPFYSYRVKPPRFSTPAAP